MHGFKMDDMLVCLLQHLNLYGFWHDWQNADPALMTLVVLQTLATTFYTTFSTRLKLLVKVHHLMR
jgi:hypothetical protein